jgi:hypothetical protein
MGYYPASLPLHYACAGNLFLVQVRRSHSKLEQIRLQFGIGNWKLAFVRPRS